MLNGIMIVIKAYLSEMGIDCRVNKNQIQIAETGTRGGYDTVITYYTNKTAGVKLYIDYDLSRGIENEILSF
jgi:hypothetical protein|nr:MAG TPA: hypothetical protein [Caudoviricetes sp.]